MQTVLPVQGMKCGKCVAKLTQALEDLPGVRSVEVSLEEKSARVRYDAQTLDRTQLREAIEESGFRVAAAPPDESGDAKGAAGPKPQEVQTKNKPPADTRRLTLPVRGMHCASCAQTIE